MWPPGSRKPAVRMPQGRSIGPFNSSTPRRFSSRNRWVSAGALPAVVGTAARDQRCFFAGERRGSRPSRLLRGMSEVPQHLAEVRFHRLALALGLFDFVAEDLVCLLRLVKPLLKLLLAGSRRVGASFAARGHGTELALCRLGPASGLP